MQESLEGRTLPESILCPLTLSHLGNKTLIDNDNSQFTKANHNKLAR